MAEKNTFFLPNKNDLNDSEVYLSGYGYLN